MEFDAGTCEKARFLNAHGDHRLKLRKLPKFLILSAIAIAFIAWMLTTSAGVSSPKPEDDPSRQAANPITHEFQKGMNFAHVHRGGLGYGSESSLAALRQLKEMGVEWVAIMPFGYMGSVTEPTIRFGDRDRSMQSAHIEQCVRDAHGLGMKVMMKPHIWGRGFQDGGKWRGDIKMSSESAWDQWFSDYRDFILHHARQSAQWDIDLLCIGIEYVHTTREKPEKWRQVIRDIRGAYDGPLTYAANTLNETEAITFWDDLDYIGVNAYFSIADGPGASIGTMKQGFGPYVKRLEKLHRKWDRPILFTEAGFRSVPGAAKAPWEWGRRGREEPIDLGEQARAYQALFETFWEEPWFHGVYWWKWFSDPRHADRIGTGHMPQPPARLVLTDFFRRPDPRG